eukprot:CAMPEP_0201091764 /NCGR_PEP_ID=MMETSP0812-20130820/228_1 /ASSEMBLY_ACC=CAM_ASM_000668 /TAXON_ID=98059 /ORGANISM="Dinobryon sp., Strain UTEXLB2267" /LENGTH=211 /DNA_ID=CAMNT_0047342885 /DNA_START=54 /DNA_END=689 /DNA_ORIENTATION=+
MPLSQEFVQFLAEGDITVDDYNSLSTAEKISAVAKFRSSAPAPAPDIVQAEIAELRREFRSSQAQPAIHQVVTLSDASIDALATALENKRRERTSVFPTPLHPIAEEVQPAEPKDVATRLWEWCAKWMLEEEKIPRCQCGPYLVSLFPVIFSFVGVGTNLKKFLAGSLGGYLKRMEESLWSSYTGLPTECWEVCSYGHSLAFSSSCSEKED